MINKDILEKEIMSGVTYAVLGLKYGYSQTGIKKIALRLGIVLPNRIKYNGHNVISIKPLCPTCNLTEINSWEKYCSSKCYRHDKKQKQALLIEQGQCSHPVTLKKYIIERDTYKCRVCEKNAWMGKPLMLQLEHIDGNSDNNHPDNLELLCPNCHSQTETFGNKGRGPKLKNTVRETKRRLRYSSK